MKSRSKKYADLKPVNPDGKRLWKTIEANILTDQFYREVNRDKLSEAIDNLPQIEPSKELWKSLETRLEVRTSSKTSKIRMVAILKIAAMIVLVISFGYFFLIHRNREVLSANKSQKDESIDLFLSRICENHPNKCKEEDFKELQGEILKLQEEKANIENSIFVSSGDEEIKKVNEMINDQIGSLKMQINNYVKL
jgi:hypothetical protein